MKNSIREKEKQIERTGILWSWGNGCKLYCVNSENSTDFQWWMFGETGMHMVVNKGLYGHRPYACERVLAHWEGFKKNQKELV